MHVLVCVWGGYTSTLSMWYSAGGRDLQELILSFHCEGSGNQTSHQPWQQSPLLTEPSCQSWFTTFLESRALFL